MRLSVASLRRGVKGDLTIEFVPQALTSYGGLELLGRYLRPIDLEARLRQTFTGLRSDYGSARIALVLLALFYVGARRFEHLRYLASDPLVARFCGLARLPTRRTVADWLRQFTREMLAPLVTLNQDLVTEALARLELPRLTIDVDGSVIRTGATVGWGLPRLQPASPEGPELLFLDCPRGPDRPHPPVEEPPRQRARLQTGRLVPARGDRRPVRPVRPARGPGVPHGRGLLPAQDSARARRTGVWLRDQGRLLELAPAQGDRRRLPPLAAGRPQCHRPRDRAGHPAVAGPPAPRGAVSKARPLHETRRNFQLDLFTPDDGHYEYSAVATNLPLGLPALWAFACGRGAQEKTFAELKGEFALDVVPTKHYAANSAWQQLSILAHNLIRSFQLETLAEPKPRSRKRTYAYLFRSMRTLRFLLIARAGRLTRLGGRNVLRLTNNPATETLYGQIAHRLAA
jgi:hypothetical protein